MMNKTAILIQVFTDHLCYYLQEFTFVGFPSDVLEIEVKDKFAKAGPSISRILGKRKISLSSLFSKSLHR